MTGNQLSFYARRRAIALLSGGASMKEATQELATEGVKVSRQTVWRLAVHYRKYGFVTALPRSGRSTKLTNRVQELIKEAMQRDDETTIKELSSLIQSNYGVSLSF